MRPAEGAKSFIDEDLKERSLRAIYIRAKCAGSPYIRALQQPWPEDCLKKKVHWELTRNLCLLLFLDSTAYSSEFQFSFEPRFLASLAEIAPLAVSAEVLQLR